MAIVTPDFEQFVQDAWDFIPHLIAAVVTFGATLLLSGAAARWARRTLERRDSDPEMQQLMCRVARWGVLILGTVIALEQINFDVTSFLAGLGIVGFTIGFALQDIARNFVAGILLLVRQPFEIGDAVTVGDSYSGQVLEINTRDTVVKTWDGEHVILPNMEIFSNPIINYSKVQYRRRTVHIGLGYDQDPHRAIEAFLEAIQGVEGVQAAPPPAVLAEELGDSSMQLVARFWVDQQAYGLFDVHSRVVVAIQKRAEQEGIDLPYPIQTVRVEQV